MPPSTLAAPTTITCPDGEERLTLDVKQLALEYQAQGWSGTLSSLSAVVGVRLKRMPTQLQEASAATQQWNEFLKGLAEGYNNCVITKKEYVEGLKRIYPRLKDDAADLEQIRQLVSKGRKLDEAKLRRVLDSYFRNLKHFATISRQEVIIERIPQWVKR